MSLQLVPTHYNGLSVSFNESGWFNCTQAASHFGKNPNDWLRLPSTQEYISALSEEYSNPRLSRIWVKTRRGNNGGTWLHPDLAVTFTRWLNIRFAIWCDRQIKTIISGNHPHYNWKRIRHAATASHKVMAEALRIVREESGKAILAHHYSNESRLINWALLGQFTAVDRDALSDVDLSMLAQLETRNSVLLGRGLDYQTRKALLREYAIDHHQGVVQSVANQIKSEQKNTPIPAAGNPVSGDVARTAEPSRD
ncbi:MAG: KilA-N domain-containing protein [Limnohabitans sp.]